MPNNIDRDLSRLDDKRLSKNRHNRCQGCGEVRDDDYVLCYECRHLADEEFKHENGECSSFCKYCEKE